MKQQTALRRARLRLPAVALAALPALLAAACGGRLTADDVRKASVVTSTQLALPAAQSSTVSAPAQSTATSSTLNGTGRPSGQVLPSTTAGGTAVPTAPAAQTSSTTGATRSTSNAGPKATASAKGQLTTTETGPIAIGSVGTDSGPTGSSAVGGTHALQVWAAEINAKGGLFGRPIKIYSEDDGGSPQTYAADLQDLVENKHVVAFVYNAAGLTEPGGRSYLEKAGVPLIGMDCATNNYFTSPVYFPQCPKANSQIFAESLGAEKALAGHIKVGFVYCTESAVCTSQVDPLTQGAQSQGMQVVYKSSISLAQIDFTANCQAAQRAGADVFLVLADANTVKRFGTSCARQHYAPQFVQPSVSVTGDILGTPDMASVIIAAEVFPFTGVTGNAAIDEFTQAFATYDPSETLGPPESLGWAAAKLFEKAATVAATKSHSLTPQTIIAALHTLKDETLGGLVTSLDFSGSLPNPRTCVFVNQGVNGKWAAPFGATPRCS